MGRLQRSDRPNARGERRTSGSRLPVACLAPFTIGVVLLAGCSGLNPMLGNDPLLGGPPIRPPVPAVPSPPAPVASLPPPAANSTLSTAALAAGAPRPLDSGRDLRIGPPSGIAGNDGWARQGGNSPQDSEIWRMADSNGATLRPPEPITDPLPKRDLVPVSNPGSSRDPPGGREGTARGITTFEQARDEIKARGALWQRLEMVGENGEWSYSCSIPNRQNPKLHRTYEARANDPIAAIRAVLQKLDEEQ